MGGEEDPGLSAAFSRKDVGESMAALYLDRSAGPCGRRPCGCYDFVAMRLGELDVDDAALGQLCRCYGVRRLSVFGSRARGDAGSGSDLDVLVEFEEGHRIGLRFISLQDELANLFGRPVDLCTRGFLSPHFRERVVLEAVPLYEAA